MANSSNLRHEEEMKQAQFAMRLSLVFGVIMLLGKSAAYLMTHSVAIFSDAAESVIHVIAVAFAAFSLRLSARPASANSCTDTSESRSSQPALRAHSSSWLPSRFSLSRSANG